MHTPVSPTYRNNGSRVAIIRKEDSETTLFQIVAVTQSDQLCSNLDDEPYPSFEELVALCAEVATDNDLSEAATQEDAESALKPAREALLPEQLQVFSDWLVGIGRTATAAHDEHYDSLADSYAENGDDQFPGERQLLSLIMSGISNSTIRLGDKTLHYDQDHGGFYTVGRSKLWTARELILLVILVLSDELTVQKFPSQGGPFLVVGYRNEREILTEQDLGLLECLDKGENLLISDEQANAPLSNDVETSTAVDAAVAGGILESVIAAGDQTQASATALETGIPDARTRLQDFRAQHFPK